MRAHGPRFPESDEPNQYRTVKAPLRNRRGQSYPPPPIRAHHPVVENLISYAERSARVGDISWILAVGGSDRGEQIFIISVIT